MKIRDFSTKDSDSDDNSKMNIWRYSEKGFLMFSGVRERVHWK